MAIAYPEDTWLRPQEDEMPDDAEPQPWHRIYWEAWEALRNDRFFGAMGGETQITYVALSAYARDHDITGNDFRVFRGLMTAIDDEWLKFQAEKQKEAGDGN